MRSTNASFIHLAKVNADTRGLVSRMLKARDGETIVGLPVGVTKLTHCYVDLRRPAVIVWYDGTHGLVSEQLVIVRVLHLALRNRRYCQSVIVILYRWCFDG